ncbi:MAG: nitroreductase family protein [bacterium]
MNSIFNRRSVRTFLDKEVESSKVELLLKAAMQAPSAANQQPWKFIVVRGSENLKALAKYNVYAGSLNNANIAIIVLADPTKMRIPEQWEQDLGAATQNILLEATELELGSVWLGCAPYRDKVEFIQNLYSLDKTLIPYSVIAIGYPKNENANHYIDRYNEDDVKYIG